MSASATDTLDWSLSPSPGQMILATTDNVSPDDTSLGLPIPANETSDDMAVLPAPTIHRNFDPDFYFNSVFVVFEVEGGLFRVPSHIFVKESLYFTNLFKLHALNNPENASATIVLPAEIQREDFRNLLKILYPISITTKLSLSESEWISVLKLSTKWNFINLRAIAISELESLQSLTSLNKIILGRLCFISPWLQSGLTEIVDRTETISNEDAIAMDYTTTIELFRLRELKMQNRYNSHRGGYYHSQINSSSTEAIGSAFEAELLSIKKAEEWKIKFKSDPVLGRPSKSKKGRKKL